MQIAEIIAISGAAAASALGIVKVYEHYTKTHILTRMQAQQESADVWKDAGEIRAELRQEVTRLTSEVARLTKELAVLNEAFTLAQHTIDAMQTLLKDMETKVCAVAETCKTRVLL